MSESLSLWPQGFEDLITEKLAAFRTRFGEAVALFDADETLWHGDIVEAHYALMEVVRRHDAYNFEGHPTVEHKADESMVAYYQRLYDAQGVHIAFEWACDVYGGHKVKDILSEAKLLFAQDRKRPRRPLLPSP